MNKELTPWETYLWTRNWHERDIIPRLASGKSEEFRAMRAAKIGRLEKANPGFREKYDQKLKMFRNLPDKVK